MISTSLRKRFEGPLDVPEAPPSPSPRPDPSLPPPLPLEQSSLPLLPEQKQKARSTPVLPSAPLPEPRSVCEATVPTPVLPPNRQEMAAMHPHATSHPHSTSNFYQMHPMVNMNNYYPHGGYNQHAAYPPYYGVPHAPIPPSVPHMAVPPPPSHVPHPAPAAHLPTQHPAPRAPIPPPSTDPRGYHDTSNPSYPRGTYQYPGTFRTPNDGPRVGGYPGELRDGAADHRGYLGDLLAHDSNVGMSYQHTGPSDALQSTLPTLPPVPST